jgi:hypothetical protein
MSTMRRITRSPILPTPPTTANSATEQGRNGRPSEPRRVSQATVAVGFVILLLVLATTSQGAYDISRWTPLGLFVLAILIGALVVPGRLVLRSRAAIVALCGIWGLAIWSLLSMLWAQSAGDAFIAADRMMLYAAVSTLPFVLPLPRRSLALAGWAVTAGIGVIAVIVLVELLHGGASLFLAGRLNAPINYRNATAALFAMGVLPCIVAAATRSYRRGVRGVALGLATLCLGLAFLTQSRGILLGLAAGEVVILALGPDRVRRAWVSVLPILAVALASKWLLRPFHAFDGGNGLVTDHDITVAAWALLIITVLAVVVGLLIAVFDNGLRANEMAYVRRAARIGIGLAAVVAVVGVLAATGDPVTYVQHKWDQFTSLKSTTPTTTRLLTVGGQRYDLWRIAVKEFDAHPVQGVGADNYSFGYYQDRRTNRNLDDPHSIVFALLSETGLVGLGLFLLFLGGIGAVLVVNLPKLSNPDKRPAVAAASAGVVLIGQSAVDWFWLIPGLTAIAFLLLGVAAAQTIAKPAPAPDVNGAGPPEDAPPQPPRRERSGPLAHRVGRILAVCGLLIAAAALLDLFISDAYVQRARSLEDNPSAELSAARTAGSLDPWSVTPLYLQSSALESMGNRPAAYRRLRAALALEPQNFATIGVLGDFEARGHHFARARFYYRRALALDPLDTGLQQLVHIGLTRAQIARAEHRRRH